MFKILNLKGKIWSIFSNF